MDQALVIKFASQFITEILFGFRTPLHVVRGQIKFFLKISVSITQEIERVVADKAYKHLKHFTFEGMSAYDILWHSCISSRLETCNRRFKKFNVL